MRGIFDEFAHNTRKSQSLFASRETEKDFSSLLYPNMLIEDIHLGLLPAASSGDNEFIIRLQPEGRELEKFACDALDCTNRIGNDLSKVVRGFVDDVARTMAYYGDAYYEIVYFYNELPSYQSFTLVQIPNVSIKAGLWSYSQMGKVEGPVSDQKAKKIKLPKEDIVHFKLPGSGNTASLHRKLLEELAELSEHGDSGERGNLQWKKAGFENSNYQTRAIEQLAHLSSEIGWHARQMYADQINEFYLFYRHLKFEAWRAKLREHILSELNNALAAAGKKIGFDFRIVVDGLESSARLESMIMDLMAGRLEFSAITTRRSGTIPP